MKASFDKPLDGVVTKWRTFQATAQCPVKMGTLRPWLCLLASFVASRCPQDYNCDCDRLMMTELFPNPRGSED